MHYLLTGKNPTRPPYEFLPVRKLSPEVTPAMEEIVRRCLQPNPDKRYSTAEDLRRALEDLPLRNRQLRQKKRLRLAAFGLAAAVICAGVIFGGNALKERRQAGIDSYYALVADSRSASDAGQFAEALELSRQAVKLQPEELAGYLAEGYCYLMQGDSTRCLQYISGEVLEKFPDCYGDVAFLSLMAQAYDLTAMPQEALYYLSHRCELEPGKPEYWLELAHCQLELKLLPEAMESMEQFLAAGGAESVYQEFRNNLDS